MPKFNPGDRIYHRDHRLPEYLVDACWDDLVVMHIPGHSNHAWARVPDEFCVVPPLTHHVFKTERKVPQEGDKIMMVVTAGPNHTEPQDVIVEFIQ